MTDAEERTAGQRAGVSRPTLEFGKRGRAELVDEHGKAFTESGLFTLRTLRAFRDVPRDAAVSAVAVD